jgi:hypothetical protein
MIVEQLLTADATGRVNPWFADPAKSFEVTSANGQPADWKSDPRKAWSLSKSKEGYMHFYGEQGIYYDDMVEYDGKIVTLTGKMLQNTKHAADIDVKPGGRGELGTRSQRFATGRIEFSPDAFDMTSTKHGAVMLESAVPYDFGAWPAFWLMPSYKGTVQNYSWAHGMEIDIMELWKGPRPTNNVMYNAVQEKNSTCGDAGKPPCEGKFTSSPLGPVGLGNDPWDPICKGCKSGLPESLQPNSTSPTTFYGYGFEWNVTTGDDGDVTSALLEFTHFAADHATPQMKIKIERQGETYSAQFQLLSDNTWTNADQMIGDWWKNPARGIGANYSWDVNYSLWQAFNIAYKGGMYMIVNLAVGGDVHCCSEAELNKNQGVIMTNDLLNCTEGNSGWGKEFNEMTMHIRSAKFFNFDKAEDFKSEPSALAKCYSAHNPSKVIV